jgi:hypothetical protein
MKKTFLNEKEISFHSQLGLVKREDFPKRERLSALDNHHGARRLDWAFLHCILIKPKMDAGVNSRIRAE